MRGDLLIEDAGSSCWASVQAIIPIAIKNNISAERRVVGNFFTAAVFFVENTVFLV
jgi:hypothetical protein